MFEKIICKLFGHKKLTYHPPLDNIIDKVRLNRKGGSKHRKYTMGKYYHEITYCERCGKVLKERYKFKRK